MRTRPRPGVKEEHLATLHQAVHTLLDISVEVLDVKAVTGQQAPTTALRRRCAGAARHHVGELVGPLWCLHGAREIRPKFVEEARPWISRCALGWALTSDKLPTADPDLLGYLARSFQKIAQNGGTYIAIFVSLI